MAKKDKKKSKKKDTPGADAVGAVRTAVERTFQATADSAQSTRTRAQDLVDEVAAAARVREMIEQVGVLEDLKGLRGEVEALARRVAALEGGSSSKPAAKQPATARASPRPRKPAARKTAARKPAAAREAGRRRRAARGRRADSSSSTASKSAGSSGRPQARDDALVARQEALLMADPQFDSAKEFRTVMDQIFTMMSEDPEMGPALKDADMPQRFEFDDFDLVVNIRAGEGGRGQPRTGSGPTTSTGSPRSR